MGLRSPDAPEGTWDASGHLALVDRYNPAGVQYHVVAVLELVGQVLSSLKDHAVHRSNRAVISAAIDLDSVASP